MNPSLRECLEIMNINKIIIALMAMMMMVTSIIVSRWANKNFILINMLMDIKDKHGYFDERFGMYYEDLDLCWRAQKKGWKAYYTPRAKACHVRAATAVIGSRNRNGRTGLPVLRSFSEGGNMAYLSHELKMQYIKNRYRCMSKNDSLLAILINLPFILWYEIRIWGYLSARQLLKERV